MAANNSHNDVIGVFDDENIIGLFVFIVEINEKYIEMTVGLSRNFQAYEEMLEYLSTKYLHYNCDFVYNPNNYHLNSLLTKKNAIFDKEQQKMKLLNEVKYFSERSTEILTKKYHEQYIKIHNTDMYWTAERILNAQNIFKTVIAVDGDKVVGYIDFTICNDENEPYDLLVLNEYRNQGFGKALLSKAIELNGPKKMMLLVDIDNDIAIKLYESLGFVKVFNINNMTAHLVIS